MLKDPLQTTACERSGKRSGVSGKWGERERSGERAKSAAQSPLTQTLRWFSDWYLMLTYLCSAFYYSISILALTVFQIITYCTLAGLFFTDYLLKYVDEMHRFLVVMEIESVARLTFLRKSMWAERSVSGVVENRVSGSGWRAGVTKIGLSGEREIGCSHALLPTEPSQILIDYEEAAW